MLKTTHAFSNDALGDHDAVALARLIRTRALHPSEVAQAAMARARRVEPLLGAIVHDSSSAPRTAATQLPDAPLAGVPTFVKDTLALRGMPTRLGSLAIAEQPARRDDPFAKQLLEQGLVVLGKSRMPELGFNASTEFMGQPPTHNPWHLAYSPGASSGGAAALVAAGVVPIAHGNDGGGSVRIPAACCGLIGLKPTRGRLISIRQARTLPLDIICEGVLTRSVRDTAAFYAGAERVYRNTSLPAIGLVEGKSARRLRVGVVADSVTGHPTDDETRAALSETVERVAALGHHVSDMRLPDGLQTFATDFSVYWSLIAFMAQTFGRAVFGPGFDARRLDNLSRGLADYYKRNITRTPMMLYRLRKSAAEYAAVFRDVDVVLSPVLGHTTPKLGHLSPEQPFEQLYERLLRYVCFTPLNNATGGPGISLPVGATREGLPIGVHASAAHGAERTLLELAFELEQDRPWRRIQQAAD